MDTTISPQSSADGARHTVTPTQAMPVSYPPAFEPDVLRWMPIVVPLLGFATALLTGLMWMVLG